MEIRNESGDRDNFTMVPNFVYRLGMSPYAVALYGYIKQAAGEQGRCYKATKTIAEELNMSAGSVSGAKDELEQNGLIEIHEVKGPHGGKPLHSIAILDVWQRNTEFIQTHKKGRSLGEQANSHDELANSPDEVASSQGEIIKNPSIKNPQKKRERKPRAPASGPDKEKVNYFPIASALSSVCQMPFDPNKGRLFKESKELCRADAPPVTPDEIAAHYGPGGWWYSNDWRGQKGELPTLGAIRQTWGQWLKPKIIPIARGKKTKGEIIREVMNGDGADDQFGLGAIFGGVPSPTGGNGHAETITGRVVDGTCRYT